MTINISLNEDIVEATLRSFPPYSYMSCGCFLRFNSCTEKFLHFINSFSGICNKSIIQLSCSATVNILSGSINFDILTFSLCSFLIDSDVLKILDTVLVSDFETESQGIAGLRTQP